MTTTEIIIKTIEIIYYITAGPILTIIAMYGLKQISITKKIAEDSSRIAKENAKKDAYTSAAKQCDKFALKIKPIFNVIRNRHLNCFKSTINKNSFEVKKIKDIIPLTTEESEEITSVMNFLEGYAIYFIKGIADDEIGYLSTGISYCNSVTKLMPILEPLIKKGHYKNLIDLFYLWKNRIRKEELMTKKEKINKELENNNSKKIRAIGL